MANGNTEPTQQTGGDPGNQTQGGAGTGAPAQGNEPRNQGGQPGQSVTQNLDAPVISQRSLNTLLAAERQNERRRYEEQLEQERGRIRGELSQQFDSQRQSAIEEAIRAHDLKRERESLVTSLGLSEAQAAVLQGDTPEALRAHATALFGERQGQTPAPPVMQGGGNVRPVQGEGLDAEIQAAFAQLTQG
jgi:hypothetical protein